MADAVTGSSGVIRLDVSESGQNAALNQSTINYAFYLIESSTNNSTWTGTAIPAYVQWDGHAVMWSGSYTFDWRGAGNQTTLIASGSFNVGHNADGSGSVSMTAHTDYTGTSGAGGPTNVTQALTLTKLTTLPGVPTSLTATRVSDVSINLAWAQANPSNGASTKTDIDVSINGAAYINKVDIGGAKAATVSAAANQKLVFKVRSGNAAGYTAFTVAAPVYTTPAAPTNVVAVKNVASDVVITWTDNVAYTEHTHEVWHGTISGGTTTWDGAALATVASGTATYTHAAPNPALVHVYQVRAVAGALQSAYAVSNSVQLQSPPNKPTTPAMPATADKAQPITFTWTHNSVDTSPQSAYEFGTSTDGGTTWGTSGKVVSTVSSRTIAASTYAANVALTTRVRTWGSATTGGSDGTGASPWSDVRLVTFKTIPTATILVPVNGSTLTDSTIRVNVGFAQTEGATFVKTQLELSQAGVVLETLDSAIQVGITLATVGQNGLSYSLRARNQDSNGLWSAWVTNTFTVTYLAPVPPVPTVSYLDENGYVQIDITLQDPVAGQSAATLVTVTRAVDDGPQEMVVQNYPAASGLTFLDTTPTVHGMNHYYITTTSALGSQVTVSIDLETEECRMAFLSKGASFSNVVIFGGNLQVNESLNVASDVISAAGRTKPIGLYGVETSVQLKVQSYIFEDFGSTVDEVRQILLVPGQACYRDPSGRRVFGSVKGSVAYKKTTRGDLTFTLTETD